MSLLHRSKESNLAPEADAQKSKSILDKIRDHKFAAGITLAGVALTAGLILRPGGEDNAQAPEQPVATASANPSELPTESPSASPTAEAVESQQPTPEVATYNFEDYRNVFSYNDPIVIAVDSGDILALEKYGVSVPGVEAAIALNSVMLDYSKENNLDTVKELEAYIALSQKLLASGLLGSEIGEYAVLNQPPELEYLDPVNGTNSSLHYFTETKEIASNNRDTFMNTMVAKEQLTDPKDREWNARATAALYYGAFGELPADLTVDGILNDLLQIK